MAITPQPDQVLDSGTASSHNDRPGYSNAKYALDAPKEPCAKSNGPGPGFLAKLKGRFGRRKGRGGAGGSKSGDAEKQGPGGE